MTVVRTTYRYKRPPRKRKAVALEVPAIVRAADPAKASKRTPLRDQRSGEPTPDLATTAPANDDRKSAIVTARRPGRRAVADVPDMTPEEHKRRGDAADELFRRFKREIAEKAHRDQ